MGQATLTDRPYVNSNLFSGHYLDERVREREEWDCDGDAREAMEDLQSLYELERPVVDGYGEDALVDDWIDEVLDVLGFGTQVEVPLPGRWRVRRRTALRRRDGPQGCRSDLPGYGEHNRAVRTRDRAGRSQAMGR